MPGAKSHFPDEFLFVRYPEKKDRREFEELCGFYLRELCKYREALSLEESRTGVDPGWWTQGDLVIPILARRNEMAVGLALVAKKEAACCGVDGEILEFYVAPPWRGQGVGYEMAKYCLSLIAGLCGFQIDRGNVSARKFWEKVFSKLSIPFQTVEDQVGEVGVIKYRFEHQPACVS